MAADKKEIWLSSNQQKEPSLIDRAIAAVSPAWAFHRERARMALDLVRRTSGAGGYEAAQGGRRTSGWRRSAADANTSAGPALATLRGHARDLVRNNWAASRGKHIVKNHGIGWGISPSFTDAPITKLKSVRSRYLAWSESTQCDFNKLLNMAGIQKQILGTVAEAGECLIRFKPSVDPYLSIPFEMQVLEPDYIDTTKDGITVNGNKVILGIEHDSKGKRVAYWLYQEHPGSNILSSTGKYGTSIRVPANEIAHVFAVDRPGQVRGVTWYAPVIARIKDHDEYEDATLMRQKIAACFAMAVTDVGNNPSLGIKSSKDPLIETIEPGMILHLPPGKSLESANPPTMTDHSSLNKEYLHGIASGLQVTYEDLTGDYNGMSFSAGRLSRISHWSSVRCWQYEMIIPQFLSRVGEEINKYFLIAGQIRNNLLISWTPPPPPMIEPDKEGLAYIRNIRGGVQTFSEMLREQGKDVDQFMEEYKNDMDKLSELGIVLDSDARVRTQAGNAVVTGDKQANSDTESKEEKANDA